MNLDDLDYFRSIDTGNFSAQIDALPEQVTSAWALAQSQKLSYRSVRHVVITGLGDAAIAGDLARALAQPESARPITLWVERVQ